MNKKKVIAFFDFDGTLTQTDSLWHFLRFASTPGKMALATIQLAPLLLGFKLGLIPNHKAKSKVLHHFFEGMHYVQFEQICIAFSQEILPGILRQDRLQLLDDHLNQGHDVCLVSASLIDYLSPWCHQKSIEVLATKMQNRDNKFHAEYEYPNCWGPQKALRIREKYQLDKYDHIYAYGDSRGDKEMLELATEAHQF